MLNDEIENDETPFVWTFNSQFGIRKKNLKALYAPEEYEEKLRIKYNASFHNMNPTESFIDSTGSKYWVWLYDMNNDSLEQNNVAHRNMDIVKRLWSELNHELKTQNK